MSKTNNNNNTPKLKVSFGWEDGKVGDWKIMREWKSRRTKMILVFVLCLVGNVEKWRNENLFVWLNREIK